MDMREGPAGYGHIRRREEDSRHGEKQRATTTAEQVLELGKIAGIKEM